MIAITKGGATVGPTLGVPFFLKLNTKTIKTPS